MKICLNCKEPKEESEFNKNGQRVLQPWCRECTTAYSREWYKRNREKHNEYVSSKKIRKNHLCKHCGLGEPEVTFYRKKVKDKTYPRFICNTCAIAYRKKYPTSEDAKKRQYARQTARESLKRADNKNRAKYILNDSKKSDIRKGRENDLDLEFIGSQISRGCHYCGDVATKMTLDRVDNSVGHIKENVVAACIRCNYLRRDMPYSAWILVVPGVKLAREAGLLDGWHSGTGISHPDRNMDAEKEVLKGL